jgi:membrane-bound metal-dependent hydrolase YbcI (DUF457 family)
MAGFHTHVTTSTVLGIGYAGVGMLSGVPVDAALVAGGLCGIGGMLPDIDSDNGVPIRETTAFAAAVIPMMLAERFQSLGLSHSGMILAAGAIYLFVRFGVSTMLKRYTVHRGMFHSIPAAILFAECGFLLCGVDNLNLRYFNAGGVLLGVMSHLVLDEIYSVDLAHMRLKKSFGTAIKFWGKDLWGNVSCYGKLIVVTAMVLAEPMMMDRLGTPVHQQVADKIRERSLEGSLEDEIPRVRETIYDTAQKLWDRISR